jgi:DNA primase large subunit
LGLEWETVDAQEKKELGESLRAATGTAFRKKGEEEENYFKVDWERVPELVEQRKVLLKGGMAYVPSREQMTLVVSEFSKQLDKALHVRVAQITPREYTNMFNCS